MWLIIITVLCGTPHSVDIQIDGKIVSTTPYAQAMADDKLVAKYRELLDAGDAALVVRRTKDTCI